MRNALKNHSHPMQASMSMRVLLDGAIQLSGEKFRQETLTNPSIPIH